MENTYIFDAESPVELTRLLTQSKFFVQMCGGALASFEEREDVHAVIDLGCGPGGWALDVAFARRDIEVAGVDISRVMIDYANARALSQNISNVSFGVMDLTEPLDFSTNTFDVVHMTLLFAAIKQRQWAPYLKECHRIMRSGGLLESIEMVGVVTNSPSLQREYDLLAQFLYKTGYGFSSTGTTIGVATALPALLTRTGFSAIAQRLYVQDFSQGSEMWASFYRNQEVMSILLLPLFVTHGLLVQSDADALHRAMMIEFLSDDFACTAYCHGIQATK